MHGQFSATNTWNGGFQGNITVTNDGSAVTAWQIEVDMPYQITNIWNAQIISQNANGYVIGNASWDGALAQGANTSFGFTANGTLNNTSIQIHSNGLSAAAAAGLSPTSTSQLTTGISISDTAANVTANLAGLQNLAAAGHLASITLTDASTPKLTLTAAQLRADERAARRRKVCARRRPCNRVVINSNCLRCWCGQRHQEVRRAVAAAAGAAKR
jgi:hypothetical protein